MLKIRLFGQFEVLHDGERLNIPTRNAQSLFAYLALNSGKTYRRERLASLLWPESSEENARSNLRHELWRLRKALDTVKESFFLVDNLSIAFDAYSAHSLDVHQLESVPLSESRATDLIEALSVYQCELLPGFYDGWVSIERERLYSLFEVKIIRLLEILQNEHRWVDILDWTTRWIALGQLPETAYRALITANASLGNLPKAVAIYERYTKTLWKDGGLKPSAVLLC